MLGILGGMGPLATADFLKKLIELTPASSDQQHIPTIVWSVPQIPDRSNFIVKQGEDPFAALIKGAETLKKEVGATALAIPCNTAHYWADSIYKSTGVPILHIVDAVMEQLKKTVISMTSSVF